ncbi:transglutaminase-like domain-containing protein [Roseicitreum antarcticum]|uniref:Transglutaminase-like superfamily protein n=1 Tax=Roseicitreum antarcticum TaxID=564137 RepID=A0A1H2RVU1_9RHOB|nr:transglutaminase family protein [Roseicitreum antarcticum]SDW22884.1 Transglutaminase-like superfamily protein [Roseicitreum antarcticum]
MTATLSFVAQPEVFDSLRDSVLGLYLGDQAAAVSGLGTVLDIAPDTPVPTRDTPTLCVILSGRLHDATGGYGPGNHIELTAATDLATGDMAAQVWMLNLHQPRLTTPAGLGLRGAIDTALQAAKDAEAAHTRAADFIIPEADSVCDHTHPTIRRQAVRLRRATQVGTAKAIFDFVQAMPYRFGHWQERASDTLAKGYGMCSTKANLQVALCRAAGLEAGFGDVKLEMGTLGTLMPDDWRAMMKPVVHHFFATVRLDGVWHAFDATYTDDCLRAFVRTAPELSFIFPARFDEGQPYNPTLVSKGLSADDFTPRTDLTREFGKSSRFSQRQFEALNTRLDRLQGVHLRFAGAADQNATPMQASA